MASNPELKKQKKKPSEGVGKQQYLERCLSSPLIGYSVNPVLVK